MDDGTLGLIVFLVVIVVTVVCVIYSTYTKKKYMKKQKETNEDKRAMQEMMSQVLGELYGEFTYLVGYYTKTTHSGRTTTYYYFPYILAFNREQILIFPFIKKEGRLYIRNRLPVEWDSTKFKAISKKNGLKVEFTMAGEKMPINIDSVIASSGVEKSDRPICVYQEQELEQFKSNLEYYKERAKK